MFTLHIQDVDSELVWQQLTDTEKEEFHKMLGDGRIGHLLDTFTLWWKVRSSLSVCTCTYLMCCTYECAVAYL